MDFFKVTTKTLDKNTAIEGNGIANVPNNGSGPVNMKATYKVADTGDSAAMSQKGDLSFLSQATSSVGMTGDSAAKKG